MRLLAVIMLGGLRPAALRKVGARSLRLIKSLMVRPGLVIPLGQRMARGTREPSS